jgi:hypothetical protein
VGKKSTWRFPFITVVLLFEEEPYSDWPQYLPQSRQATVPIGDTIPLQEVRERFRLDKSQFEDRVTFETTADSRHRIVVWPGELVRWEDAKAFVEANGGRLRYPIVAMVDDRISPEFSGVQTIGWFDMVELRESIDVALEDVHLTIHDIWHEPDKWEAVF